MTRHPDKASLLAHVCGALAKDDLNAASAILRENYPFIPLTNAGRHTSELAAMRLFIRDGFIDRYSGQRLVFPGTLRLLSLIMPNEFPFHNNWKTDACHFAFYELCPTIDHVVPVSRGGLDQEENLVSTSMVRNTAKANFTLAELGWTLQAPGNVGEWDGLTGWCVRQFSKADKPHASDYVARWVRAAKKVMSGLSVSH